MAATALSRASAAWRSGQREPGRGDDAVDVLVIKGLTLPEVSDADLSHIQDAAGPGATVTVVERIRDAFDVIPPCEIVLGFMPPKLFEAATKLRWVHATASGVDGFLTPSSGTSDVVLTGEKGLVGGHLADHGFGLLLAITRRIAPRPSALDRRVGCAGRHAARDRTRGAS